jgi:dUTP pyrophosphatase
MGTVPTTSPDTMVLDVELRAPGAQAPRRATPGSAGYDLCCAAPVIVPAGGRALIDTGVAIKLPPGTYGRVAPRSGLAVRHGLSVGAGVIDGDYRGEVKVLLFNHGDGYVALAAGDRIAQLIVETAFTPAVRIVEALDATARGAGGFGSTGVGAADSQAPPPSGEAMG